MTNPTLARSRTALRFLGRRLRRMFAGRSSRESLAAWNGMFNQATVRSLRGEKEDLESFDLMCFVNLNDPRLKGQIVFEYGTLLNFVADWQGKSVLDVGSGRSSLPYWLAARGAQVTAFEHPSQIEMPMGGKLAFLNQAFLRGPGRRVRTAYGDMRQMEFAEDSFDCVMCLSVLEHLDTDPETRAYVPYEKQKEGLRATLNEIIRVTKPGGFIYLTTECCNYDKVRDDKWKSSYYFEGDGPEFSSAWPAQDVQSLFYDYVTERGCELVGPNQFAPEKLEAGEEYWTFRGPTSPPYRYLLGSDDASENGDHWLWWRRSRSPLLSFLRRRLRGAEGLCA